MSTQPDDFTVKVLRAQAWARAKGELEAMLYTFYSPNYNTLEQFQGADEAVKAFIKHIEDNGLAS